MNGDDYIKDEQQQQQQQQQEVAAEQPVVADGYFSRVNGGMIQSGKYDQHIVSLIGQIISHDTIRTADGSTVQLNTEHLATEDQDDGNGNGGSSGLLVDPNEAVEIMGQVTGPTEITVRFYDVSFRCVCCVVRRSSFIRLLYVFLSTFHLFVCFLQNFINVDCSYSNQSFCPPPPPFTLLFLPGNFFILLKYIK